MHINGRPPPHQVFQLFKNMVPTPSKILEESCPDSFLERLQALSKRPQDLLAVDVKKRKDVLNESLQLCKSLNGLAALTKDDEEVDTPLLIENFSTYSNVVKK